MFSGYLKKKRVSSLFDYMKFQFSKEILCQKCYKHLYACRKRLCPGAEMHYKLKLQ